MDDVVVYLPTAAQRLANIRSSAEKALGSDPGEAKAARPELGILAAFLKQEDRELIVFSVNTALEEGKNFHGASQSLQQ